MYYCSNCRKVPSIKMKENTKIEIKCNCSQKEESNTPHLSSFIQEMDLKEFISELNKPKNIPKCEINNDHVLGKMTGYCTECRKWFCEECLIHHRRSYRIHTTINSDGLVIETQCENKACPTKNKIEFYCNTCGINLCFKCFIGHEKDHKI